jgi:DnaJ-domain-containing protein 1
MRSCPHCQAELESPLGCRACGRVLALDETVTPFELFGLPLAFEAPADVVKRRLVQSTRLVHPDFHAQADAEQRALAEHNSARLNEAHALLSDDVARADWIVRFLGGPDENAEREMPRAFLLEVLEWNETLESARPEPESAASRAALATLGTELVTRRVAALANVARLLTPLPAHAAPALRSVRQELNALRYLDRALAEIAALRSGNPAHR